MEIQAFRSGRRSSSLEKILMAVVILLIGFGVGKSATAQTFSVLHTFKDTDGSEPQSALVRDAAGNFYGTTEYGGHFGVGVVYKLDTHGKQAVLHTFSDRPDGARPIAGLTAGGYGTTYTGGIDCREEGFTCGTVFKLGPDGTVTKLYAFQGGELGADPYSGVLRDAAGDLYGTTVLGGDGSACGVVYRLDRSGKQTVLHAFAGSPDGCAPYGTLIADSAGNLYGTTSYGGRVTSSCPNGCGTIYGLRRSPSGWETKILHSFAGSDGSAPYAGLTRDSFGNLYGTTAAGGNSDRGTVFQLDPSLKLSVLYSFTGGVDGRAPWASLVRDSAGNLYGTTFLGGIINGDNCFYGCGVVFKVTPAGTETVLHAFNDSDGTNPNAGLFLDLAGHALYGTASLGGDLNCNSGSGDGSGCGTVFRITQ